MPKIILDTDIGTDIDDAAALTLCLHSPEIDLVGVTATYGHMDVRVPLIMKILDLAGRKHIPVAAGCTTTLLRDRAIYWGGFEGKGFLAPGDPVYTPIAEHAIDFIARMARQYPKEIILVPIGPLTNIALSIIRYPELPDSLHSIVLMGGSCRVGGNAADLPPVEHNIGSDPEAAKVVFESGIPLTVIPLDVTMKTWISKQDIQQIRAANMPHTNGLCDMFDVYFDVIHRDTTHMHDPLAVAMTFEPSLCAMRRFQVRVETRGTHTTGSLVCTPAPENEGNAWVCIDVDAPRFNQLLIQRLKDCGGASDSGAWASCP